MACFSFRKRFRIEGMGLTPRADLHADAATLGEEPAVQGYVAGLLPSAHARELPA